MMLRVENLSVRRGQVQTLRDVSLEVNKGEIVSLVGSNGAGKSTLLYAISGTLPISGKITFNGQSICGLSPERITRLGIGLVPEGRQIFGELSVLDNLILGAYSKYSRRWQDLLSGIGRVERKPELQDRLATVSSPPFGAILGPSCSVRVCAQGELQSLRCPSRSGTIRPVGLW